MLDSLLLRTSVQGKKVQTLWPGFTRTASNERKAQRAATLLDLAKDPNSKLIRYSSVMEFLKETSWFLVASIVVVFLSKAISELILETFVSVWPF